MKVLFLDIDGVLNSYRSIAAGYQFYNCSSLMRELQLGTAANAGFDPTAVNLLRQAQADIGFKIVISSTWRLSFNINHFHKIFDLYGWDTRSAIISSTQSTDTIRGDEVKLWLDSNPEVKQYVILDDSMDFLEEQLDRCVFTKYEEGMTYATFAEIYRKFGHPEPF